MCFLKVKEYQAKAAMSKMYITSIFVSKKKTKKNSDSEDIVVSILTTVFILQEHNVKIYVIYQYI